MLGAPSSGTRPNATYRKEFSMQIRHMTLALALASVTGVAAAAGNHAASSSLSAGHYAGASQQASDQQVRDVQQNLKQQGFNPGPVDGIMGPRTEQALRSYQQARGLNAT